MMRADAATLRAVGEHVLGALGATDGIARDVTDHLLNADLRGHGSHGLRMIPIYASLIDDGELVPDATPTVEDGPGQYARVDGERGFGQLAGLAAVEQGVELATDGMALVGVGDTTHLGRIGEYGERAAEAGMLFVAHVSVPVLGGDSSIVAPLGSTEGRLGTNPICFGVPTFDAADEPIVMDMATSQVALGKIRQAAAADEPLEPEWTTDGTGDPFRDAAAFMDRDGGAILPAGGRTTGHKGFGLAVIVELFASLVGDGPISGQEGFGWGNTASFLFADPTAFSDRGDIEDRVRAFGDHLEATEYTDDVGTGKSTRGDRGVFPGRPEYRAAAEHRREGVPMPAEDLAELGALADDLGVGDVVPTDWPAE